MDDELRRRDRRHLRAIAGFVGVGLAVLAVGILLATLGWDVDSDGGGYRARGDGIPLWMCVGGTGLVMVVIGLAELGHRLVKGPQRAGRHARG
ncbi:MAG TPA: hypothetical protein VNS46_19695 [Nocardioides sp.]|nr:hypothetical protein [Nocardioides sp.]